MLTRSAVKARKLTEQFGVRTVVGSMESESDFAMLTAEAAKADVVLHIVRHLPSSRVRILMEIVRCRGAHGH